MTSEDVGSRIAMRRQLLGWTQEELASRTGVSRGTVVNWETGRHWPKRKLGLLEEVLGIDLLAGPDVFTINTPDEAAIFSLDRFSEAERRALVEALREIRAGRALPPIGDNGDPANPRNCAVNSPVSHRVSYMSQRAREKPEITLGRIFVDRP